MARGIGDAVQQRKARCKKGALLCEDDVVVCVPHDRHSCPIQKLRVIAQASLHSAHDGVMLDKPQDYL